MQTRLKNTNEDAMDAGDGGRPGGGGVMTVDNRPGFSAWALTIIGMIGVSAVCAFSMAMNYRFGYSLGRTPFDGVIYGGLSVALDGIKALAPFYVFAAFRTRQWARFLAGLAVLIAVLAWGCLSASGHSILNRTDSAAARDNTSANYKDLRAELKRETERLAWVPAHRPADTVRAELNVHKAQRYWLVTSECADVKGKGAREYCQQYHKLSAELASGIESGKIEAQIAGVKDRLGKFNGAPETGDPQAALFASVLSVDVQRVQQGLALFIMLVMEIVSAFGMYVVTSPVQRRKARGPAPGPVGLPPGVPLAAPDGAGGGNVIHLNIPSDRLRSDRAVAPASPIPAHEPGDNDNDAAAEPVPARPAATAHLAAADDTEAAVAMSASPFTAEPSTPSTDEQTALRDLLELFAQHLQIHSQQWLARRWNADQGLISRWMRVWEAEGWIVRQRASGRNSIERGPKAEAAIAATAKAEAA